MVANLGRCCKYGARCFALYFYTLVKHLNLVLKYIFYYAVVLAVDVAFSYNWVRSVTPCGVQIRCLLL